MGKRVSGEREGLVGEEQLFEVHIQEMLVRACSLEGRPQSHPMRDLVLDDHLLLLLGLHAPCLPSLIGLWDEDVYLFHMRGTLELSGRDI